MKKEKFKNKLLLILSFIFIVLTITYFKFRDTSIWIVDILPELMGSVLLGVFIIIALKKRVSMKQYLTTIIIVLMVGIFLYIYGINNNIRFLIDLSPELLGSTGLSLILSVIFKRKIWA
jgi:hypothetical protein